MFQGDNYRLDHIREMLRPHGIKVETKAHSAHIDGEPTDAARKFIEARGALGKAIGKLREL